MRVQQFLLPLLLLTWVTPSPVKGQTRASAPDQAQGQSTAQTSADLEEAGRQHALGVELFKEKKYDEALVAAKRAVELREKSLGAEHYLTRASLSNLSQVYIAKQDYGEAIKVLRRLLPIYEKVLKPGSDEVFKTLEQLASLSFYERKLDDAEKAYKRNLELRESTAGDSSPQTARALFMLASFYHFTGKPEQAKPLYHRAISIWEKNEEASADSPEYMTTLERYSCLLSKDKHDAEAEELSKRAVLLRGHRPKNTDNGKGSEIELQGGVLNGSAINKPAPHYPETARQTREQGTVVVRVVVDESGRVVLACAISGPEGLRDASENAAYGWRFTPTRLSGVPVRVTGTISFHFELR